MIYQKCENCGKEWHAFWQQYCPHCGKKVEGENPWTGKRLQLFIS